jgi:hypothetical protein
MLTNIDHPVLGTLKWNGDLDCWESKVELRPGFPIHLSLMTQMNELPKKDIDKLHQRGVEMLNWARNGESACRQRIADDLYDVYINNWVSESTTTSLLRTQFMKRIEPNSLVRDFNGGGYFYWQDDGLFAGHWIEVRFNASWQITEVGLAG